MSEISKLAGDGCQTLIPGQERKPVAEIERMIVKKYRKSIWSKFTKAIRDYNLVEEGDKIAVAISGGKDSLLMAKLFQELKRHKKKFCFGVYCHGSGYHPNIRNLPGELPPFKDTGAHFSNRYFSHCRKNSR